MIDSKEIEKIPLSKKPQENEKSIGKRTTDSTDNENNEPSLQKKQHIEGKEKVTNDDTIKNKEDEMDEDIRKRDENDKRIKDKDIEAKRKKIIENPQAFQITRNNRDIHKSDEKRRTTIGSHLNENYLMRNKHFFF